MAKNAKSIGAAAAAFTVSFNALNGAIDLYAKQVVAERAGWAESDVIMPPFSKYVWIESQPGKGGGLDLVVMGDDKLKRDQTSADGKEKARQVWNDEAGNARRLQFAHFADEKRGLAVCEQLQAFWAGNNLRPSARFALLTDDAARELAGILLAHFPYNNQGGGKYAPRAAKTAERAKATASKGIAALATLKKKGEAVEVDEEQRRLMLEIAGVPAAEIDKLLAKGKKAKAKA